MISIDFFSLICFSKSGTTEPRENKTLPNLRTVLDNGVEKDTLRIIELQRNFGQTPALLAGLANIKGDLVVTMDGDLQNDPQDIPQMLDALTEDYDVICGWRKNRKDNSLKKLPSKFKTTLSHIVILSSRAELLGQERGQYLL